MWSVDILSHFGRTSKSARYAGWLSFRVQKVIVHILKWMRNLTGTQCNRFRIGMERLSRGALVTTLARQFWTRCNLAISFSGILWNSKPMCFRKFKLLSNTTAKIFSADAVQFVTWPGIKHGKLFRNFSSWSLVPMRRKSVFLVNLSIIGIKMVVYVKTGDNSALNGVVYRVKSTSSSTEPCGTPNESVTLSECF